MTPVSPREAPGVSQGNVVQNPKMLRDWPEALKIHATGTPPRWRLKGWERQWRRAAARGLPAAWTLRRGPRARLPGGRPAGRRLFRAVGSGAFGRAPPTPGQHSAASRVGGRERRSRPPVALTSRRLAAPRLGIRLHRRCARRKPGHTVRCRPGSPEPAGSGSRFPSDTCTTPEAKAQSAWSRGSAAGRGRGPRSAPTWSRTPRGGAPDGEGAWDPREADAQASVTGHGGEART